MGCTTEEQDYYARLGARVRRIRQSSGILQVAVARAMGVPPSEVYRLETGAHHFSAVRFADYLDAIKATASDVIDVEMRQLAQRARLARPMPSSVANADP